LFPRFLTPNKSKNALDKFPLTKIPYRQRFPSEDSQTWKKQKEKNGADEELNFGPPNSFLPTEDGQTDGAVFATDDRQTV